MLLFIFMQIIQHKAMLTLQNFEKQISTTILERGKLYYSKGCVTYIEESGNDKWEAEVEGSETYTVEVTLKNGSEVSDYLCDCPYDGGGICKHIVAVLFALQKEKGKPVKENKKSAKKDVFQTLLQSVSIKELQNFIQSYSAKNRDFKTAFELFFADKDSRIDVEEKYKELVEKLIRKYTSRGYIDYRASNGLSKEVDKLLGAGTGYVAKNNFRDAFALAKAVLKPMMVTIQNCDDSNGNLGGTIESSIELLGEIAGSNEVATDIKEEIFIFLMLQMNDKSYFDYGDFGYNLFHVFQDIAVQLNSTTAFLTFVDVQILNLTGKHDEYQKEFFQKRKIEFLQQTGKADEAEKQVLQNMDIVEVRK